MISFFEKKLNLHLSTYIKEGGFLAVSYIIGIFCTLLTSLAFAHLLPKSEYGLYKLLLSISAIMGAFTLTGINTATTRAIAQNSTGIYRKIITYQLLWNSLITICALIYVLFFPLPQGVTKFPLLIISFSTLLLTTYNTYSAYYNGKRNFKVLTTASISTTLVQTLTIILLAWSTHSGAHVISGFFVVQTIMSIYFHLKVLREEKDVPAPSVKPILNYGIKLSIISFVKNIAEQSDKILTFSLLGPVALAIYSFAYALPDQMRGFYKIIPSLALPHFSAKDESRVRSQLKKYLLLLFGIALFGSCTYVLIAPIIFHTLFPTYLESIRYSQALSITTVILALQIPLVSYLNAYKKTRAIIISNFAQLILDSSIIIICAQQYGIWGVVVGKMVSATILLLLLLVFTFFTPLSSSEQVTHS
jgi:O-antigen/teichoic acid export membrane protein